MRKIRVFAEGEALVARHDLEPRIRQFVGRVRQDAVRDSDGEGINAFVPKNDKPDEVPFEHPEAVRRYRRAAAKGELIAADEASAQLLGVKFDRSRLPAEPAAKPDPQPKGSKGSDR